MTFDMRWRPIALIVLTTHGKRYSMFNLPSLANTDFAAAYMANSIMIGKNFDSLFCTY
jgi:hypothetical protein